MASLVPISLRLVSLPSAVLSEIMLIITFSKALLGVISAPFKASVLEERGDGLERGLEGESASFFTIGKEKSVSLPSSLSSSSALSRTSRKTKRSQEARKDSGVFFSPMPITTLPASRIRVASLLKSPSLETIQNPSTSPEYKMSMASIIRPISEAFLPGELFGCIMGVRLYFEAMDSQLFKRSWDQSPYMRRIVTFPYLESSLRIFSV